MTQASLPSYTERLEQFKKVKQRICNILLDYPHGLTTEAITLEYIQRYRHTAIIDNKLRDLRKEGEVMSFHVEGSGLLRWRLNEEKWTVKKP